MADSSVLRRRQSCLGTRARKDRPRTRGHAATLHGAAKSGRRAARRPLLRKGSLGRRNAGRLNAILTWPTRRYVGSLTIFHVSCILNCEVGYFIEVDKVVDIAQNRVAFELAVWRVNLHRQSVSRKEHRRFDVGAHIASRHGGESKRS